DEPRPGLQQPTRVKFAVGIFAGVALVGSLSIAVLNVIVAMDMRLVQLFEPSFPVLNPLLFLMLSGFTARSLWTTIRGPQSEPGRTRRISWIEAFRATGHLFHVKVAFFELLQLFNQARNLVRLLFIGQAAFWLCAYSGLICLNAVVTPILHFSPRVQNNTFFLILFDALIDTTFGAFLPACMVVEVTFQWLGANVDDRIFMDRRKIVQALLVGRSIVPTSNAQLASLAWPYISLWVKFVDLHHAREFWSSKGAIDQRRRVCGPWIFGLAYLVTGLTVGLLGITARLRSPCWSKSWTDGCSVFRFDLSGSSCQCAYFEKHYTCVDEAVLQEMLRDSRLLGVLSLKGCPELRKLPPLSHNVALQYLVLDNNGLEELPLLSPLADLRELHAQANRLRELPDLSSNAKLTILDVEKNELSQLPSLEGNPKLTDILAASNNLSVPPELSKNPLLQILNLEKNALREAPSLDANLELVYLFLETNELTALPSLRNNRKLQVINAEKNQLKLLPSLEAASELEQLWLVGNQLQELPSLEANTKLQFLDVSMNDLQSLPSLAKAEDLKLLELTVAFNQIERLDLTSPAFRSLTYLNLDSNLLESVVGLDSMVDLTHLHLANNALRQLPDLAGTQLSDLDLSHNRLQTLPFLGSLRKLSLLNAESNYLTSVSGLENLTGLVWLRLANNNLTELPSLKACKYMRLVSVSHNSLVSIGTLPTFLDELNAGHNRLSRLSFPSYIRMHSLDLRHNLLEEFSLRPLANSQLLYLSVRGNRLKRLPGLENLEELRFLDASENQLTEFPPGDRLYELEGLCLTNNNLPVLPGLFGFRFLQSLGCAENPLSERPQAPEGVVCDCCANPSAQDIPLQLAWCVHKTETHWRPCRVSANRDGLCCSSLFDSPSHLQRWQPDPSSKHIFGVALT
ncbi:shoc2, partial [Symbiodinium microadriaticum]